MHEPIRQRCIQLANLLIETNKTVRALAEQTGYSKSTIHKDLTERLPVFSEQLALQVKYILEQHKATRHLRGGEATRMKWAKMRDPKEVEQDEQHQHPTSDYTTISASNENLNESSTENELQLQQPDTLQEQRPPKNEIEVPQ